VEVEIDDGGEVGIKVVTGLTVVGINVGDSEIGADVGFIVVGAEVTGKAVGIVVVGEEVGLGADGVEVGNDVGDTDEKKISISQSVSVPTSSLE
jgi:hypothetical protein